MPPTDEQEPSRLAFTCGGREWVVGAPVHVHESAGPGFDATVDGGAVEQREGGAGREVLLVRLGGGGLVLVVQPDRAAALDRR